MVSGLRSKLSLSSGGVADAGEELALWALWSESSALVADGGSLPLLEFSGAKWQALMEWIERRRDGTVGGRRQRHIRRAVGSRACDKAMASMDEKKGQKGATQTSRVSGVHPCRALGRALGRARTTRRPGTARNGTGRDRLPRNGRNAIGATHRVLVVFSIMR